MGEDLAQRSSGEGDADNCHAAARLPVDRPSAVEVDEMAASLRALGIVVTRPFVDRRPCLGRLLVHDEGGITEVVPREGLTLAEKRRLLEAARETWIELGTSEAHPARERLSPYDGWVYIRSWDAHMRIVV